MRILLTGGSRGIGKAIKDYFEKNGHVVIAPTRNELDLSNVLSVKEYLSGSLLDIDVLVNNAGINELNTIEALPEEELLKILQVNLLSAFTLVQHFLPQFKAQQYGRIVNIGSIWTERTMPKRGGYSISKEGLYALTKMIAVENSCHNILCNMVSPGFIETELTRNNNSPKQIQDFINNVPCHRLGKPEEVAELVYFLCDKNNFITGQNIFIDGGYTINY